MRRLAKLASIDMHESTKNMQFWTAAENQPIAVDVVLFDRFSNHCLANLLEPFRAANTLARDNVYDWRIYTLDGNAAVSSSGLSIVAHDAICASRRESILFVVSSYGYRQLDSPVTRRALRKAASHASVVVGMDTGAWLLASSGLLDECRATIHWDLIDAFAERFLAVDVVKERFVVDRNVITCGGATAAFDLALDMIRRHRGEALRLDIAALFMHELTAALPTFELVAKSRLTTRALTIMQEAIEEPLSIGQIATRVSATQRQLERRFNREFGASPTEVYRSLRLAMARRLLENSDLPVSEIALRVGYLDASAMSRAFKQRYGASPRSLRLRSAG